MSQKESLVINYASSINEPQKKNSGGEQLDKDSLTTSTTNTNSKSANSSYKIRFQKAGYQDIGFLVFLRKLTMNTHLKTAGIDMTDDQHQARVMEHFDDSYLIMLDDNPVGLIQLGVINKAIHIRQFQIHPDYQGRGLGKRVLDVCKKKARQRNTSVTLYVLLENPAKNLYLRNGFEIERTDKIQHFMRFLER